jgi:AraC-like DNA-binding protein
MEKLQNTQIEEIIDKFKNNIESETYLVNVLGLRPCFVLKKTEKSKVFGDLHHHDLYEILYVKSGKISYSIDELHYEFKDGDLVLISPTSLHRLDKVLSDKCERFILTFSQNYLNYFSGRNTDLGKAFKIAKERKKYAISFDNHEKKNIEKYLENMNELQFAKDYGADVMFNLRFMQTMLFINSKNDSQTNEFVVDKSNKIIYEVVDYINENLSKKILIKDLASKLSLSESRLSHLFKEETGISILKFINKKRLMLSKEYIRNGEHLGNIHSLCGFQDNTSFFRAFKKEYGITPKTYYKNCKLSQD